MGEFLRKQEMEKQRAEMERRQRDQMAAQRQNQRVMANDALASQIKSQTSPPTNRQQPKASAWGQLTASVAQSEKADLRGIQQQQETQTKLEKQRQAEIQARLAQENMRKQKEAAAKASNPAWAGLFDGGVQQQAGSRSQKKESLAEIQEQERRINDAYQKQLAEENKKKGILSPNQNSWARKTGSTNAGSAWGATNSPQPGRRNEMSSQQRQFIDPAIAGMGNMRVSHTNNNDHNQQQQQKMNSKPVNNGTAGWTNTSNKAPINQNNQNQNNSANNNKKQKQKNANNQKVGKNNNNNNNSNNNNSNRNNLPPGEQPHQNTNNDDDLITWTTNYIKNLSGPSGGIDGSMLVSILSAIESSWEVKDFFVSNFGETKEAKRFADLFIEKRNKIKKEEELRKKNAKEMEIARQNMERRRRDQEEATKKKKQNMTLAQQNRN